MAGGKKLVIVESPTKMKSIQGYLGDEYEVLSSVGHIRDLAKKEDIPADKKQAYGKYSIDVENGFDAYYVVSDRKTKTVAELEGVPESAVPADAVTASASGLDPDISPAYASIQVERVATARKLPVSEVRDLVAEYTRGPDLGYLGDPTVNVVELNLALDRLGG